MAARSVVFGLSRLVSTRLAGIAVSHRPVKAIQFKVCIKILLNFKKYSHENGFIFQNFHTSFAARCEAEADQKLALEDDPKARDRIIPVETSIAYLESDGSYIFFPISSICNHVFL